MSDLGSQEETSKVYTERNEAVAVVVKMAQRLGYPCWYTDAEDADWPIVFIELPYAGQVSWHIPREEFDSFFPRMSNIPEQWDGHDNEAKASRLRAEARIPVAFRINPSR